MGKCDFCGEELKRKKRAKNNSKKGWCWETPRNFLRRKFCNRSCGAEARSLRGEKNPWWTGGKQEITCIQCGKKVFRDRAKASHAKFCSIKCFGSFYSLPPEVKRQQNIIRDRNRYLTFHRKVNQAQSHAKRYNNNSVPRIEYVRMTYQNNQELTRTSHRSRWNNEEIKYLIDNYNKKTTLQIAQNLDRTYGAVMTRINFLHRDELLTDYKHQKIKGNLY